jgi:hypothetical protein
MTNEDESPTLDALIKQGTTSITARTIMDNVFSNLSRKDLSNFKLVSKNAYALTNNYKEYLQNVLKELLKAPDNTMLKNKAFPLFRHIYSIYRESIKELGMISHILSILTHSNLSLVTFIQYYNLQIFIAEIQRDATSTVQ